MFAFRSSHFHVQVWMFAFLCSHLFVRAWMFAFGCRGWMFAFGCSHLDLRIWMIGSGCSHLDVRIYRFTFGCSPSLPSSSFFSSSSSDRRLIFFRLFHVAINGEANSFGMYIHRLFEAAFFQEFLLGVANNIGLSLYFAMQQLRVFLSR